MADKVSIPLYFDHPVRPEPKSDNVNTPLLLETRFLQEGKPPKLARQPESPHPRLVQGYKATLMFASIANRIAFRVIIIGRNVLASSYRSRAIAGSPAKTKRSATHCMGAADRKMHAKTCDSY